MRKGVRITHIQLYKLCATRYIAGCGQGPVDLDENGDAARVWCQLLGGIRAEGMNEPMSWSSGIRGMLALCCDRI